MTVTQENSRGQAGGSWSKIRGFVTANVSGRQPVHAPGIRSPAG